MVGSHLAHLTAGAKVVLAPYFFQKVRVSQENLLSYADSDQFSE